jgi:hypothetical protein
MLKTFDGGKKPSGATRRPRLSPASLSDAGIDAITAIGRLITRLPSWDSQCLHDYALWVSQDLAGRPAPARIADLP